MKHPLSCLPPTYSSLQSLIDELPRVLLQTDTIEGRVNQLPNYSSEIEEEKDPFVWQALFRAYAFLVSGYTMEASYKTSSTTGYGKARRLIPHHIAKPFVSISEKLQVKPWLDYHYAYSLGNYLKHDSTKGLDWKNLHMACSFSETSDETGFIMLHVYINEVSPQLVSCVLDYPTHQNKALFECAALMMEINARRREMWTASRHEHYNDFRVFIMGIKGNQDIFGDGVVYEGCFDNQPQQFRGQTGAQDSIIPLMDIFTGIVDYYPTNQLTEYLMDLRSYRPVCIQEFFTDVRAYYQAHPLIEQLDDEGLVYLLQIVDQIYLFRNGHWQFVQKYIMANVSYAQATGGTPITSWLINQIEAVLEYERVIMDRINLEKEHDLYPILHTAQKEYVYKVNLLQEQVAELKKNDFQVELIYESNQKWNLEDKL
jgi:indoleamine 2,3-dioxygenase